MGFCRNFLCCGTCFLICAVIVLIGAVSYKKLTPTPNECLDCNKHGRPYGDIGNIAILTNALSDSGTPTAKALYQHGTTVVMGSPDITHANKICTQILKESNQNTNQTNQANLVPIQLNLSDFNSIDNFVREFKSNYSSLNILINNDDSTENNHLVHFYLTQKLTPLLQETKGISRVIHMCESCKNINPPKELLGDINKYGAAANMIYNGEYNKRYGKGENGTYSVHLHSGMVPFTNRLHVDAAKKAFTVIHFASMDDNDFAKYENKRFKHGEYNDTLGKLLWNSSTKSIHEKGYNFGENELHS